MRQSVDDDVVSTGLAQIERLDRQPLDFNPNLILTAFDSQVQISDDLLEADRPTNIRTQ
jgi:hypothetical protein